MEAWNILQIRAIAKLPLVYYLPTLTDISKLLTVKINPPTQQLS
jgi:hypothetical protein